MTKESKRDDKASSSASSPWQETMHNFRPPNDLIVASSPWKRRGIENCRRFGFSHAGWFLAHEESFTECQCKPNRSGASSSSITPRNNSENAFQPPMQKHFTHQNVGRCQRKNTLSKIGAGMSTELLWNATLVPSARPYRPGLGCQICTLQLYW